MKKFIAKIMVVGMIITGLTACTCKGEHKMLLDKASKETNAEGFKTIAPKDLDRSVFKMLSDDWMLILGEKNGKQNAMTASWGGMGVIWGKDVTYMFVRQQRYTKEFIDGSDTYSLNFFDESYRKTLNYMGTVSGKTEKDKMQKSGLTVVHDENGTAYFKEAKIVFICKKIYARQMDPKSIQDKKILETFYSKESGHSVYIGEIQRILIK